MPFLYPIRTTLIIDTWDLITIADRVRQNAPDIDVVIVESYDNLDLLNDALRKSPVLMVSFEPPGKLRTRLGQIFANAPFPKIEQYRARSVAGIPTLRTSLFDSLSSPGPDEWGA